MYLTVKQQAKHLSKEDYKNLKTLCHVAKNLHNQAVYNIRQYYFTEKQYLSYQKNYALLKSNENYKTLNSNMAQQILMDVDESFKSFFSLQKLAKQGKYKFSDIKLPSYLPKDGYATLIIGFIRLNDDVFILPYSQLYKKSHNSSVKIKLPPILQGKTIKEIRIIPRDKARFFEIQYTYEVEEIQRNLDQTKALAIDLGINNLMTCVTSEGDSFIVDGKKLKSINQWFNKEQSRLQTLNAKQHREDQLTHRQKALARKRNNRVNDYISKAVKHVINYCIDNNIGILVVGYNESFQRSTNLGACNNQNFVNVPFGKLRKKLKYLCQLNSITYVEQEESYTSKASFWDKDIIPVYGNNDIKPYKFSGNRVKRGLYKQSNGKCFNADVNGALNILRKSMVVSLERLYRSGEVNTPVRIRVA